MCKTREYRIKELGLGAKSTLNPGATMEKIADTRASRQFVRSQVFRSPTGAFMNSRAIFSLDVGFYIGIIFRTLFQVLI